MQPSVAHPAEQPFQVGGFGEGEQDGVVGGLGERLQDLHLAPGVYGRAEEDFLEEVGADQAGAGEGGEQATGPQQAQRQPIQVFVAPRRPLQVALAVGEFGRVEYDHVELTAVIPKIAQYHKSVAQQVFVQRPFPHPQHILLSQF